MPSSKVWGPVLGVRLRGQPKARPRGPTVASRSGETHAEPAEGTAWAAAPSEDLGFPESRQSPAASWQTQHPALTPWRSIAGNLLMALKCSRVWKVSA